MMRPFGMLLLPVALSACMGQGVMPPAPQPSELASFDCNRDNVIDRTEIQAFWINESSLFGGPNERAISASEAQSADQNGDSKLSYTELSRFLGGKSWGAMNRCPATP